MRRLILFRHAEARLRASGEKDFDRPLTAEGRFDAGLMARTLASAGYSPDVALVSAAVRTRQTWDAAAAAFPETKVEVRQTLYDASADRLSREARAAVEDGRALMIVAHNPGLQLLALSLADGGSPGARQLQEGFPTASAAVFAIESGRSRFERLFRVKDFGGEA